jgi:hypothetical protein
MKTEPLGATLTRTDVNYEYDEYSDDEMDELDVEIAAERAKIKSAAEVEKLRDEIEKHQKKIAALEKKLQIALGKVSKEKEVAQ